jgi:protein tyrosine/serine phosphatase
VWSAGAALSLALAATAQDPCAYEFPQDANPTPITSEDVCNFHQVDAQLYRGGRPRASAFPKLIDVGIRTIISLEEPESAEKEKATVEELNQGLAPDRKIDFVSFPISPAEIDETGVSHERLRELFDQIRESKRPIFVHCYHGKDRTGAVVALYRMLMNQMAETEAFEEAYRYRFSRRDHGLRRTLDRYKSPKKLQTLPRPEAPK